MKDITIKFRGYCKGGHFKLFDPDRQNFEECMKGMFDGQYYLVFKKDRKNRSLNQNSYYWGVVVSILASSLGYFLEEMHEILKWKFNSRIHYNHKLNKETRLMKSSTELTTVTFNTYCENIRMWAAQGGDGEMTDDYDFQFTPIVIPEPNQIDFVE